MCDIELCYAQSFHSIPNSDLNSCLHYFVDGDHYQKFFRIRRDMLFNNHITPDDHIYLKLYILGDGDVRIQLSAIAHPPLMADVYEIALDSSAADGRSEVRMRRHNQALANSTRRNVLVGHIIPLLVRVSRPGRITVHVDNETEPLLSASDSGLEAVKYLSFASGSADGRFVAYFDCHSNKKSKLIYFTE